MSASSDVIDFERDVSPGTGLRVRATTPRHYLVRQFSTTNPSEKRHLLQSLQTLLFPLPHAFALMSLVPAFSSNEIDFDNEISDTCSSDKSFC